MKNNELELISSKEFKRYDDMYKIIDFLNKNLSSYGIVLGISEKADKSVINIYKENR
ncbi:DUF4264 family protein [Clostridium sp. JNZ X4-2]